MGFGFAKSKAVLQEWEVAWLLKVQKYAGDKKIKFLPNCCLLQLKIIYRICWISLDVDILWDTLSLPPKEKSAMMEHLQGTSNENNTLMILIYL